MWKAGPFTGAVLDHVIRDNKGAKKVVIKHCGHLRRPANLQLRSKVVVHWGRLVRGMDHGEVLGQGGREGKEQTKLAGARKAVNNTKLRVAARAPC